MTKNRNPFLIYGYEGSEYFCDRTAETANLMSAVSNGRNVTLTSIRRMGKTGLILNAFNEIRREQPKMECFYMDIFSTNNLQEFTALFAQTILGNLDAKSEKWMHRILNFFKNCRPIISNDAISGMPTVTLDFVPSNVNSTLQEVFSYIKESGKECVIAIDEFQQVAEYPEQGAEALLRSLMQFVPNAHFIFSGSKRHIMNEMFSSPKRPFYQSTQKMDIGAIAVEAYYEFAQSHFAEKGISISLDVFTSMYDMVGGHTWYVQRILNKMYEMSEGEIGIADVHKLVWSIVKEEEYNFQKQYSMLTRNQQLLLRAVANEGNVQGLVSKDFILRYSLGAASSVVRARDFLVSNEYLLDTASGYQVYDHFFAFWLAQGSLRSQGIGKGL